jgi:PAS domain S-box-containing protein
MHGDAPTGILRETLEGFDDSGAPETTREVAERLGVGRRSAYDRLARLADGGHVETKKVGASGRVWWRPPARDDGRRRLDLLVGALEDSAVCFLDVDGRVRDWNRGAATILGYAREEVVGEHLSRFYAPAERADGRPERDLAAAERGTVAYEGWRVRADGSRLRASLTISAARDGADDLEGFVAVVRDVTDRYERERRLRAERDLLGRVLETSPVGIVILDASGEILRANGRAETLLALTESEMEERSYDDPEWRVWHGSGESITCDEHPVTRVLETREPVVGFTHGITLPDGTERWLSSNSAPVLDESGAVDRVVVALEDVTQLREQAGRLERQRDDLESELDHVFERVSDGVYALDGHRRFTYVNGRAESLLDLDGASVIGRDVREELPCSGALTAGLDRALESQERTTVEEYDARREAWFATTFYPSPSGVSGYVRDVTDRVERERTLSRYETVVETIEDGVYVLDEEYRFTQVNDAYCELTGYDRATLLGSHCSLVVGEDASREAASRSRALAGAAAEHATVEAEIRRADGTRIPGESRFTRLPGGEGTAAETVGVVRDLTERKRRERDLERYRRVVGTMRDGVYAVDAEGEFVLVNDAYCELMGYERERLLGSHVSLVVDDETVERAAELGRALRDGDRSSARLEAAFRTADGERRVGEARSSILRRASGDYRIGVVRDLTERRERERALGESEQRYRALARHVPNGGVALFDADLRYELVEGAIYEEFGIDTEECLGTTPGDLHASPTVAGRLEGHYRAAIDGESREFELTWRGRRFEGWALPVRDDEGAVFAGMAMIQDVTEREARERELQARIDQQETVSALGRRALENCGLDALMAEAAELVSETLGTDYCKVLDLDEDGEELLLRQGTGWADGLVGSATVSAVHDSSQAAYTLLAGGPVVVSDLETESRFGGPALLTDHEVRSGISTIVGSPGEPWGILGAHDTDPEAFVEQDVAFVQSVATILASAIDRRQYERTLIDQREQLEALNSLNRVVRGITRGVIETSTREAIERTVCERLASSRSYESAWIGEIDADSNAIVSRVGSGAGDHDADRRVAIDDEAPGGAEAITRAVRTGAVQVTDASDRAATGTDDPLDTGGDAQAAIPIAHGGVLYGVLCVSAARADAFTGDELAVVDQLGGVVGHAITAIERKRALTSDQVHEIEIQIDDLLPALDVRASLRDRITIDRTVPVADGECLAYGTVLEEDLAALESVVAAVPAWERVRTIGEGFERTRFELRAVESSLLSNVADQGGYLERAWIDDGHYRLTVRLPRHVDGGRFVDDALAAYPGAEVRAQRQVRRSDDSAARVVSALEASLTDRQRSCLETAFHAGFFEWPRRSSGADVAQALGITPPTFFNHLRGAERRIFGALFETSDPPE